MNTFKEISSKWQPQRIKVLLIGESPPAQAKNFFFYAPNSDLYNFTKKAFENVYKDKISEYPVFLNFFMDLGCFLDDLCEEPVNYISDKNLRRKEWENSTYEFYVTMALAEKVLGDLTNNTEYYDKAKKDYEKIEEIKKVVNLSKFDEQQIEKLRGELNRISHRKN